MGYSGTSTSVTNLAVSAQQAVLTSNTSPAAPPSLPPGYSLLTTLYGTNLVVTIVGSPTLAAGLQIYEQPKGDTNWYKLNQTLQVNGTNMWYTDPVGYQPPGSIGTSNTSSISNWPSQPPLKIPTNGWSGDQDVAIKVGTTVITNRIQRSIGITPSPPGSPSTNGTLTIKPL